LNRRGGALPGAAAPIITESDNPRRRIIKNENKLFLLSDESCFAQFIKFLKMILAGRADPRFLP
jgi:hypothetical protein